MECGPMVPGVHHGDGEAMATCSKVWGDPEVVLGVPYQGTPVTAHRHTQLPPSKK